jgi:outer membrane protein assembly factor BamB
MTAQLRACRLRSKKMNVPHTMAYKSLSTMIIRLLLVCVPSLFGTSAFFVSPARAQSADWPMFAGNAAHTGVNDVETGTPPLMLNWTKALSAGALNPVTVEGDRVFVTPLTYFAPVSPLWALSATDGSELWNHNFPNVFSVNPPSVQNGLVYVQMGNHAASSRIFAFHVEDGTIAWSTPYSAQWERYYAPTLAEGKVFVDGGYYGGMYAFDATMGDTLFYQGALEQYDQWTPTYADGVLYTFIAGHLRAHDPSTGQILGTVDVGWRWAGWSMNTVAVLGDGTAFVIAPPILFAVEPLGMTVLWQRDNFFNGTPTYSQGVVYANQQGALQAREAGSGDLLWTFVPPDQLRYPAVIANGFLYISSDTKVHALDLSTHAEVWSNDGGGWLSIANGQLYVAGPNGTLTSYTMTPGTPASSPHSR